MIREEIKELKVDGERIPTLEEALDFIDKKVKKNFDRIKGTGLHHFTHTSDVKSAPDQGLKIIVWTINKKEDVKKYIKKKSRWHSQRKPDILDVSEGGIAFF